MGISVRKINARAVVFRPVVASAVSDLTGKRIPLH
jgi:hypothetical protein